MTHTILILLLALAPIFVSAAPSDQTEIENQNESNLPLLNSDEMDELTIEEMEEYRDYLEETGQLNRDLIPEEDFAAKEYQTPKDQVKVTVACNPKDGKFYLQVFLNGKPYDKPWLTSPGKRSTPTKIPKGQTPYGTTKYHVTSRRTSYPGIPMPYTVWIVGGYATHGTKALNRLGYPASHGCLRLHHSHAKSLYKLTRKVGLSNVRFHVTLNYNCGSKKNPWVAKVKKSKSRKVARNKTRKRRSRSNWKNRIFQED